MVEKYLTQHGYQAEAESIQRSTLDRVIKAKKRRLALGISKTGNGELHAVNGDEKLVPLLRKLVADMSSGKLSLANTLRAADVDQYLGSLQGMGYVTHQPSKPAKENSAHENTNKSPRNKPTQPLERKTLIPSHINYHFSWIAGQSKIQLVWEELQYSLKLKEHAFSIAIVLRVLLEISAKNYRDKFQLKDLNTLSKNLSQNLDALHESGNINTQQRGDIRRILNDKQSICSIENLQRVVHSSSQVLSNDDLITLWDCIEPLVVNSIRAVQEKKSSLYTV
ncbi:hypothetical protein [Thalassobius sp. Cn5-15]|uniref:hypothetical protein n=1 Tax=Thalassobius sp. Cn5-15 TaxID=2917763 RepID=UPI001EF3C05A|nr:hypothetical protein [Thalassobius sp. Cn5-15]MCG7493719.1 hypothetical protein [Thalassobius sp. Cn5-15]